jgi:NRAMP (natural resistance-associated macrophage protein)-like metal ion transporter
MGPGIISGSVDNDAGGITTYSIAGATFGYSILWLLIITGISLVFTQEIGARMGLATGKGLASLIREKFGVRWTAFIMAVLFIANIGTIAAEFAGIAASFEIFNIPRHISLPLAGILIFIIVTKGSFRKLERLFLLLVTFYIAYFVSAFVTKPDWSQAVHGLLIPTISLNTSFLLTAIAVIGTTITPWGQFFIQNYIVDKKLSKHDLKLERIDVLFGSFLTHLIAFFIIVVCAETFFSKGILITDAKDAALALQPIAGEFASILFAFGFLNASLFGAILVPVSTSYVITEAFGLESGLNFSYREAPEFYGLLAASLIIGGLLVMLPFIPLINILFLTQALNAILLLPIFVFLFILSNDRKILGDFVNSQITNIIVLVIFAIISVASILYFASLLFPGLIKI